MVIRSPQPCPQLYYFIGAKVAGHRGYYLTNDGVDLNQALISYGLDYLRSKQYKKIQPPFFMNKDQMAKTAQLDQFDEELYKVCKSVTFHLYIIHKLSGRHVMLKGDRLGRREIPHRHFRTTHFGFPFGRMV